MSANLPTAVPCNRGPHRGNVAFRNAVAAQEVPRRIGTVDLEAQLAVLIAGCQPDIVEHRRDVEQFGIETKLPPPSEQAAPEIDANGMVKQQVAFGIANQLGRRAGEPAVRDRDACNVMGGHGRYS